MTLKRYLVLASAILAAQLAVAHGGRRRSPWW